MKRNKGITLVALVITIIILLILAGITLMALTGDNGLFTRAKEAKEKTQKGAATEKINLVIADVYTKSYAEKQEEPTLQDLADGFCDDEETEYVDIATRKTSALNKIEVGTNEAIYVKLKNYPYEFKINGNLKIATIDGVEVSDPTGGTGNTGGNSGSTGDTENTESGGNGGNSGNSVTIDKEEYEKLKSTVASLSSQMSSFKSDIQAQFDDLEGNIQQRLITSETLFTGSADTIGKDYTIKDISGYKYLLIYFDATEADDGTKTPMGNISNTMIIDVKDIKYGNDWSNARAYSTNPGAGNAFSTIYYFFKSETKLSIFAKEEKWFKNQRIYRIDGIY